MNGCKNCPAYAKCTATYRGSACAALRHTYGLENDPEIVTNADRIRAMSDEELAEWLVSKTAYQESAFSPTSYLNFLTGLDDTKESAFRGTVDWLRQPVGVGE